jgi:hypothetical protein
MLALGCEGTVEAPSNDPIDLRALLEEERPLPEWTAWSGERTVSVIPAGWVQSEGCFKCDGRFTMMGASVRDERRAQCPPCDYLFEIAHEPFAEDLDCLMQADVSYDGACRGCGWGDGPCFDFSDPTTEVYGLILKEDDAFEVWRTDGNLNDDLTFYGYGQVLDWEQGAIQWRGGDHSRLGASLNVYLSGQANLFRME